MRKQLIPLILLSSLLAMGCTSGRTEKPESKYWHTITIDGCEYLENSRWNDVPLTHKANCKNPIHKK